MIISNGIDLKAFAVDFLEANKATLNDPRRSDLRLLKKSWEIVRSAHTINLTELLHVPVKVIVGLAKHKEGLLAKNTVYWYRDEAPDNGIFCLCVEALSDKRVLCYWLNVDDERVTGDPAFSKSWALPWAQMIDQSVPFMDRVAVALIQSAESKPAYDALRKLQHSMNAMACCLPALTQANEVDLVRDFPRQQRDRAKPLGDEFPHRVAIRPQTIRRFAALQGERMGSQLRLHQVREHGADYTQGRGLFGKHHVTIQKRAHVRGDPALGILRAPHWEVRLQGNKGRKLS